MARARAAASASIGSASADDTAGRPEETKSTAVTRRSSSDAARSSMKRATRASDGTSRSGAMPQRTAAIVSTSANAPVSASGSGARPVQCATMRARRGRRPRRARADRGVADGQRPPPGADAPDQLAHRLSVISRLLRSSRIGCPLLHCVPSPSVPQARPAPRRPGPRRPASRSSSTSTYCHRCWRSSCCVASTRASDAPTSFRRVTAD